MIIRKIKLRNIKSYYGEHILELPHPGAGRNLHLLGAHNGSGKTTLFEAINACLFATNNNPMLRANHLSRGVNAQNMEVELEFEDDNQSYRLSRIWTRNPGVPETSARSVTLTSFLQNLTAGNSLRGEQDEELMSAFVNYLVPRQISHFFLFDGEAIQEYTEAPAESVRDAIENLLGLHYYIQLEKDLSQIEGDLRANRNSLNINTEHNEKLGEHDIAEAKLKDVERRISQYQISIEENRREVRNAETRISSVDGIFDEDSKAKRRELESKREGFRSDIESADGEFKKLIANELMVSMFWQEIQQAYSEVSNGHTPDDLQEASELEGLIRFLWEQRREVISALNEESPASLQSILTLATENRLEESLYNQGVEQLAQMVEGSSGKLWTIPDKVTELNKELNLITHQLSSLPSPDSMDVNVRELQQEISDKRMILSQNENLLADLVNEQKRLQQELEQINDELHRLGEQDAKFQRANAEWTLCGRVRQVLKRFIENYRASRIGELEDTLNRKFLELTNSPETVGRVEIDRNTFAINTILRSEANLAASEGSAGQKEVMAFSLIASVVDLSQKQLPIIIDTPLARLDTIHRDNILANFFPRVAEQVIILSTDSEVGFDEYSKLSRYLASAHHLTREDGQTSIEEGYLVQ